MYPILVVGAGFSGATIARYLAEAGFSVSVIDKRSHVAGNAFDYVDSHGIRIHKYGPHLFHTNDEKAFQWLSRFTQWVDYQHRVQAMLDDGCYVVIPPNITTLSILGEDKIIDKLYRPYTKKMWGLSVEELDPSIISRVSPSRSHNELYFPNDRFQFIPVNGYTSLVTTMLDHPNIDIKLGFEFSRSMVSDFGYTFNSMPIDEFFDYRYGQLPYRSIRFHHVSLPLPRLLPVTTVNLTNTGPFTRITEWKNIPLHGQNDIWTSLTYDEPCDYLDNHNERYYPVKDISGDNRRVYEKYTFDIPTSMEFIGRCGLYVYLDMDKAVVSALAIARRFLHRFRAANL
jgi:UDP-galactopyranose mutase